MALFSDPKGFGGLKMRNPIQERYQPEALKYYKA